MKELQQYTYTIPANGSVQIPAANDNWLLQASNGPVAVRGNTFGRLRGVVAGMGLKMVPFERLEVFDESGAPNTFTLLMTPAEFVNQTFSGSVQVVGPVALDAPTLAALESVDLNNATLLALRRPELPTNQASQNAAMVMNTPQLVIPAALNVNGAIIWDAEAADQLNPVGILTLIAKATAPANIVDGEVIATSAYMPIATTVYTHLRLGRPVRIAAGLALWYIASQAGSAASGVRFTRYTLL